MIEPIPVTYIQYWTIIWMLVQIGLFHLMTVMFKAPHERDEDESHY